MKINKEGMKFIPKTFLTLFFVGFVYCGFGQKEMIFGNASFLFSDSTITVSTGKVERQWQWTGKGFRTIHFENLESGKEWAPTKNENSSDWNLPTKINNESKAELVGINCVESDDERFTSPHLLVTAHLRYLKPGVELKYLIRVYPDVPGIWTAMEIKSLVDFTAGGIPEDISSQNYYGSQQPVKIARAEFIPVDFSVPNQRRYWGFYNDPGNRHNSRDMVREEVMTGFPLYWDEQNTWASGLSIESGNEGLILVKESNKTVNNYGHQTGAFYCTPNGVEVTGWGLKPEEITSEFRRTWATWSVLFSGGDDEMQLALKQFDRTRYPVHEETDIFMVVDTWGSDWQNGEDHKIYGRENSNFTVVEKEIKSAGKLGIDIVRIDDGWQEGATLSKNSWHPNTKVGYSAHWENVKKLSTQYGVKMGLWAAIRYISMEELLKNQKELKVANWKFDFDRLENWEMFHKRTDEIREFVKAGNYSANITWCPEYSDQRYGWYSPAREYGSLFFQNLKNNLPAHLVYKPYITLKHHWMMSRFFNLNKLQCGFQNPALVNSKFSDAYHYSLPYCALTSFAGIPSCFFLTQFLTQEQKKELQSLIKVYKKHREAIFKSFVFPIGDKPDNASWAGFQIHDPDNSSGFLMLFRELYNSDENGTFRLKFLKNKKLDIYDLMQEDENSIKVNTGSKGELDFVISSSPGFKFLKYKVTD